MAILLFLVLPGVVAAQQTCEALVGAPEVRVTASTTVQPTVRVRASVAIAQSANGSTKALHANQSSRAFLGLTSASLLVSTRITMRQIALANGQVCASPIFEINLSFSSLEVSTARELEVDRCSYDYVLNHEMMHVHFHKEALVKAAAALQSDLAKEFPPEFRFIEHAGDMQYRKERLAVATAGRAHYLFKKFDTDHTKIDNGVEYSKGHIVCNGVIPRLVNVAAVDPQGSRSSR